MAVATIKATAITNRDASPKVLNDPILTGAFLREMVGVVEAVSGNSIGSKYIFGQIPSNARVSDVLLSCDDIGTTTIADFGLYQTTDNGGAVVSAAFFGSAVSLKDGALNQSVIQNESGTFDIANSEMPLWQALGLTSDPRISYDVVATLTAAADAGGTIALRVRYAQ